MDRRGQTTTSLTGMRKSSPTRLRAGFTLVELVIVMTLLAVVAALSVPAISRSIRARHLKDEATRFVAATEYARDEAVSQGVPMTVWIDPTTQHFGVEAKTGFVGSEARHREFAANPDIHFETDRTAAKDGLVQAVEMGPDGTPTTSSIDAVRLVDRFNSVITVVQTKDGWAYEILKEAK